MKVPGLWSMSLSTGYCASHIRGGERTLSTLLRKVKPGDSETMVTGPEKLFFITAILSGIKWLV